MRVARATFPGLRAPPRSTPATGGQLTSLSRTRVLRNGCPPPRLRFLVCNMGGNRHRCRGFVFSEMVALRWTTLSGGRCTRRVARLSSLARRQFSILTCHPSLPTSFGHLLREYCDGSCPNSIILCYQQYMGILSSRLRLSRGRFLVCV